MAVRRESVVLSLEDNFTAGMVRAAAATKVLERELDGLSGHAVKSRAGLDNTAKSVDNIGTSADRGGKQIDRLSGRLALLTQAAAVLGPALVPIGAAAIPAVAGLSLQLGLAAGAAGVTVLAFKGIGEGLKALNAYQLKPSAENFGKLNAALDKLGPAGQEFVLALDKMTPKFRAIQAVAEQGMLPGVTDGLNEVIGLMPQFRQVVFTISSTLGDLARDAGKGLGSEKFRDFFDYLTVTARPVLTEMGHTIGNFIKGIANLMMAVDPLSRSFSTGFLDMSKAFAEWTDGLSGTKGFQDFVDYISSNGGKALDAIGAIANALLQIVEAAAPVGAAVLPVITALADGLAAIADSPAGPALLGAAAGFSVLSRAMALIGIEMKGLKATGLTGGGIASLVGGEKMKAALPTLGQAGTVFTRMGQSAKYASEETLKARASVRGFAGAVGPSVALVGGLALASSGLAEKTGLANTASFALMGTIAGPWGTAIGAGVGYVSDLAAANDDLVSATKASDAAFQGQTMNLQTMNDRLQASIKASDDYYNKGNFLQNSVKGWTELLTHAGAENAKSNEKNSESYVALKLGLIGVADAMGGLHYEDIGNGAKWATVNNETLQKTMDLTATAFDRAGKSAQDTKDFLRGGGVDPAGTAIVKDYVTSLDSAEGKSKSVAAALAALGSQMESNVSQADALKAAMDSLFGVQMSQSEATDAWTQNLKALAKTIGGTNGAILGTSKAALTNRAAIRGSVQALEDKINTDAAAGVSGRKLVDSLIGGRDAIIKQAKAAGASEGAVRKYLHTLGLTPKNLTTIITENGSLSAKQKVQALTRLYHLTPKQVRTLVSEAGSNPSRAKVEQLSRAYHLTPKQVRTILQAIDQASGVVARVRGILDGINGKVATTFIRTINQHVDQRLGPVGSADGGTVPKTGLPYADRHPYLLADGEEIISNRHGQADRFRADRAAGRIPGYADGGRVGGGGLPSDPKARSEVLRLMIEIRDLRRDLAATGKDQVTGLERQRKLADLAATGRDLTEARNAPAKEAAAKRKAAAEKRKQARESFDLTGDTDVKAVREAFDQFREDLNLGSKSLRGLEARAVHVSRAFDKHSKILDEANTKRDQLRSDKAAYAGDVTSAFTHDPFGNGLAGLKLQLEADRNDAMAATGFKNTLEKRGISAAFEKALLASGDLNTLSQAAQLSRSDLAGYSSLYASSTKATSDLGNQVASRLFDQQIQAQTTLIRQQTATLKVLNQRMEGLEAAVERGARAGVGDRDKQTTQRRKAGR